ncbi:MAG: hypothetical protein IFK92_06375 [Acidobacteria bacterium]|nr:hypothetical protein [Candidatus Sulfomarinibacter kjeldsenii]
MTKKRAKKKPFGRRWKHLAWGAAYKGVFWPDIRLAYSKKEMWKLVMMKCNCKTRQKVVARGYGVCRVQVTKQQVKEER